MRRDSDKVRTEYYSAYIPAGDEVNKYYRYAQVRLGTAVRLLITAL